MLSTQDLLDDEPATVDESTLVGILLKLVCDFKSLSLACKGAHWNVSGIEYYHFHLLFDTHYEEAESAADRVAEHLFQFDAPVPFTPATIAQMSSFQIPSDGRIYDGSPLYYVQLLLDHSLAIKADLKECMEVAEAIDSDGTENLIQDELERLGKRIGFYKRILK